MPRTRNHLVRGERIHVSITQQQLAVIDWIAARQGKSQSEVTRDVLSAQIWQWTAQFAADPTFPYWEVPF